MKVLLQLVKKLVLKLFDNKISYKNDFNKKQELLFEARNFINYLSIEEIQYYLDNAISAQVIINKCDFSVLRIKFLNFNYDIQQSGTKALLFIVNDNAGYAVQHHYCNLLNAEKKFKELKSIYD